MALRSEEPPPIRNGRSRTDGAKDRITASAVLLLIDIPAGKWE